MHEITRYAASLPTIPDRSPNAHKGTFGTVFGVGGSRGMSGAVALAGRSALLGGAGLVRLAVPDPILETVAGFCPNYTTVPISADVQGRISINATETVIRQSEAATALFLGPGLGRSAGLDPFVRKIVKRVERPLVVDADALNSLGSPTEPVEFPRIFTPHPGEFTRLTLQPTPDEEHADERIAAAVEFSKRLNVVLVLKGHATIITDGDRVSANPTGNPGMATGGSGDVLTGLIASLLAQGFPAFDAARLGVFLHGLAGDFAAKKLGQESVVATSIIDAIPEAIQWFRAVGRSSQ